MTAELVHFQPEGLWGVATFDEFWSVYPRRAGKLDARKAWAKAVKLAGPDVILAGACRYAADPNREAAYTAHPSTWLNQGRWDDDPLPARPGRATATDKAIGWLTVGKDTDQRAIGGSR